MMRDLFRRGDVLALSKQSAAALNNDESPGLRVNRGGLGTGLQPQASHSLMSFGLARNKEVLEISKARAFTSAMPAFFGKGLKSPIDTMEYILQVVKDVFKAEKVTVYAVDASLQNLFKRVRGSRLAVKKIDQGETNISAIHFETEEAMRPLFTNTVSVNLLMSQEHLLIPINNS